MFLTLFRVLRDGVATLRGGYKHLYCVRFFFAKRRKETVSFLIGLISGIFGGLVGLGGGVVMVPLLSRLLRLSQQSIHGTSLVAVVFAGLSGAAAYAFNGTVDYRAALILAVTASLMAREGARCCVRLPGWKLRRYFGFFLIILSLLLIAKPFFGSMSAHPLTGWEKDLSLVVIGLATGFLAGLLGTGGGAFTVLAILLVVGMNQYTAQGCSLLALVPAGAVGAYTHWRHGNIALSILPGLIGGIILGAFTGGLFANLMPEHILRIFFATVLVGLGIGMIRRSQSTDAETCDLEE
jgi:uncharacterized membrane protein YfcA